MSLHEIIQESLHLSVKEKAFIIEALQKSLEKDKKTTQVEAFGLLKKNTMDPVAWQKTLRTENDSDLYK